MTEAELQRNVLDLAKLLGYRAYHTHDSRRSEAGFPDLVLVSAKRERLIFAELKSDSGKATADQLDWLEDLGQVREVHSVLWRPPAWTDGVIEDFLR